MPIYRGTPIIKLMRRPVVAAGGGNTMALDGGSTAASVIILQQVTLTTTGGSGLIVLGVVVSGSTTTVTSVTATGLTFTNESVSPVVISNGDRVYMFTAPYTTNFSGTISVNLSAAVYNVVSVMGISGAKTASADDAGGPVSNASGAPSMTTTNANDCVVAIYETDGTVASAGSGWSGSPGSAGANFAFMEYRLPSATGTFTASMSAGTIVGGIITGIKQGP